MRSQIGFVPADGGYYSNLTVDQNLKVAAALRRRVGRRAVDEAAAILDLCSVRERRASTLSKGQKKRLAIACALVGYPEVLLLDEPCADLDVNGLNLVQGMISMLCARHGATVVVASALPPSGLRRAGVMGVVNQGRLSEERAIGRGFSQAESAAMLEEARADASGGSTNDSDQG